MVLPFSDRGGGIQLSRPWPAPAAFLAPQQLFKAYSTAGSPAGYSLHLVLGLFELATGSAL
jgi:hypothetical protein